MCDQSPLQHRDKDDEAQGFYVSDVAPEIKVRIKGNTQISDLCAIFQGQIEDE